MNVDKAMLIAFTSTMALVIVIPISYAIYSSDTAVATAGKADRIKVEEIITKHRHFFVITDALSGQTYLYTPDSNFVKLDPPQAERKE